MFNNTLVPDSVLGDDGFVYVRPYCEGVEGGGWIIEYVDGVFVLKMRASRHPSVATLRKRAKWILKEIGWDDSTNIDIDIDSTNTDSMFFTACYDVYRNVMRPSVRCIITLDALPLMACFSYRAKIK